MRTEAEVGVIRFEYGIRHHETRKVDGLSNAEKARKWFSLEPPEGIG